MAMSISEDLAAKASNISFRDLPTAVIDTANFAFEDTIGVAIAGANTQNVDIALAALNPSIGPSTIWCRNMKASALDASFVNATASHALDFDDGTITIGGHPSTAMIAPIIALAEEIGASGQQIIEAYVVGFEIMARLGDMSMPEHYTIGWHPTSTLGIFGATAACSKLLGLSQEQVASALAIVPSLAGGMKSSFGTEMKSLQVGAAARNGLFAAKLAAVGCNAKPDSIEGENGYFSLFNNGVSYSLVKDSSSDSRWRILHPGIVIKQHPCCGSTHSAIDAAINLFHQHGPIRLADVEKVIVRAHSRRLGHTFNAEPTNGLEAKFSIQFVVAVALAKGSVQLSDFIEPLDSSLYTPFKEKLEVISTEFEDEFKSTVEVQSGDTIWLAGESTRLGRGSDRPLSLEERDIKFMDCAGQNYLKSRILQLHEKLRSLVRLETVSDLTMNLK